MATTDELDTEQRVYQEWYEDIRSPDFLAYLETGLHDAPSAVRERLLSDYRRVLRELREYTEDASPLREPG